ncbi:Hsp70 family protein [Streptomyces sp. CB03238]|uniref:Hsp70 family protein n=1 Tax=Streptomyces sp. CB03238 TaxID=1907777 RepID=UPI002408F982|nr:Hsp70 family protein [Streptomyces sp. CB03238]
MPFPPGGCLAPPEQLSAGELKSLRQDATHELGEPPAAAVITVPAGCSPHQAGATCRAAALARLGDARPLFPELVAAARAYGVDGALGSAHRLVFHRGSGQFRAAVVEEQGGESRVPGHAGDPHLGEKNIDRDNVENCW